MSAMGSGCGRPVTAFIQKAWHGKVWVYKCGQTGVDGYPVLCPVCHESFDREQYRREIEECGERIEEVD